MSATKQQNIEVIFGHIAVTKLASSVRHGSDQPITTLLRRRGRIVLKFAELRDHTRGGMESDSGYR